MSAVETTPTATAREAVPYVGLRPFGPEEHDWFYGRDADAQFLVDKILSARLTLMYAPSGVGKSSLLRARVVASIEAEDCRVVYFDAWAGREPIAALKERLAELARSIGVTDPLAGAPTLAELVQLSTSDGQTVVLLLDQFEEFLINHAQHLDPLRKEIAALVKAHAVDARVLIALREEFLAAIEPFRPEILTLFQSTYRLENLSVGGVKEAIIKPAARFGGDVSEELAGRLSDDLSESVDVTAALASTPDARRESNWRTFVARIFTRLRGHESADKAAGPPAPASEQRAGSTAIDLPMLQLVCEHLWRAAPVVNGRKALTLDLYEQRLGGRKRILDEHIRSRMPARWRDRLLTATLMRFLAPPSGLKISYSAADLAELSRLDRTRVQAELMRLSGPDSRILRQRDFKDGMRFELQHDALIRHITPWRDAVLGQALRRRRHKFVAVAAAIVLALVVGERLRHQKEVRDNTEKRLTQLRAMSSSERGQHAGNTFDSVASYLLFQERGSGRFDRLRQLLVENEDLVPEADTTGAAGADAISLMDAEDSPLALRFNADAGIDVQVFSRAWTEVAQRMNARWGIPVPLRVQLISDGDFPRTTIQLESSGERLVRIDLEPREGMSVISTTGAPEAAREFHRRFARDWQPLSALGSNRWWGVPRWSLPVWRAAGLRVWSQSAYPALAVSATVDRDPTIVLTEAATQFLVHRVGQQFPCTASEAWAIRGTQLRRDLIEWVAGRGTRRALLHPHLVFDTVADLGAPDAARHVNTSGNYFDILKLAPDAPWPRASGAKTPCEVPELPVNGYQKVDEWLPALRPKIRIALGAELVRTWSDEPQLVTSGPATSRRPPQPIADSSVVPAREGTKVRLSPQVVEPLEHYREDVFKRNGIWLPDATFSNAGFELSGDLKRQFRIALLDVRDHDATPVDARSTDQQGIDRLISSLDAAISPAALAWVDAEYVGRLLTADSRNHALLKQLLISVTDLKLLLRAVIKSRADGPAAQASSTGVGSVRDSDWLISSLVFWKAYYEDAKAPQVPNLLAELTDRLRNLQARRDAPVGVPKAGAASSAIQRGIAELEQGQLDGAEKLFRHALQIGDRAEVESLFVESYAARWQASRQARIKAVCDNPLEAKLDYGLRIELDMLVNQPKTPGQRNAARDLALCLLSSMPPTVPRATAALRQKIAAQYGAPKDWPPTEARWFARQLLDHYDPVRDPATAKDQGAQFLTSALRRLPSDEANKAFNDLAATCWKPGPRNWCWEMLPAIAEARPNPWTALDLAVVLSRRQTSRDARDALRWVEHARSLSSSDGTLTPALKLRFDFWSDYIRAAALTVLGTNGEAVRFEEAQRFVLPLVDSRLATEEADLQTMALLLGHQVLEEGPRPDAQKAATFAERGLKLAPDDPTFWSLRIFRNLRGGDVGTVQSAVRDAFARASAPTLDADKRAGFLFASAVGGLMSGYVDAEWAARQFIRTGHPYAPLVSMLLSARTKGVAQLDARRLLEQRWARVDRGTWDNRLAGGDGNAWYEMLLGYFAGKVTRQEIFDPLRDDRSFAASKFAGLPMSRSGMLTEANFYDAVRFMEVGDRAREIDSLRRVVEIGYKPYVEYDMAVHLLRVESSPGALATASR